MVRVNKINEWKAPQDLTLDDLVREYTKMVNAGFEFDQVILHPDHYNRLREEAKDDVIEVVNVTMVESTQYAGQLSMRAWDENLDRLSVRALRKVLTDVFEEGDEVIMIKRSDLDSLRPDFFEILMDASPEEEDD